MPLRTPFIALALFTCAGCAFGSDPLEVVDPAAAPERPTWTQDVQPIMDYYCTTCHSPSGALNVGVSLDTCDNTRRSFGSVWSTAADSKSMPPGGALRVSSYDLLILDRWHAQGATCD